MTNEEQDIGGAAGDLKTEQGVMPLPYIASYGERLSDGSECRVIDCEQGSVAEMMCPKDAEDATARFLAHASNRHGARERLLNVSLDLLSDVYDSRAGQRFSAIGLSRIKSHIADLRSELALANESAKRPISDHPAHGQVSVQKETE